MIRLLTPPLWQWSTGRSVEVIPAKGCTVDEVHFFNGTTDTAKIGLVTKTAQGVTAKIPNAFLQSTKSITVYSVMVDSMGKHTNEVATFYVNARPKPEGYVCPEDVPDVPNDSPANKNAFTAALGAAGLGRMRLGIPYRT